MRVGFLGPEATFTHEAVTRLFPDETLEPFQTIPEGVQWIQSGRTDACLLPLENALEGSVSMTMDALIHEELPPIRTEIVLPIRQQLMVHPLQIGNWQEVTKVFSHPHAIHQCRSLLYSQLTGAVKIETTSTAAAAKIVKEHPNCCYGAIANQLAAAQYGLTIVKQDVQDYTSNETRFILLTNEELALQQKADGEKTTLLVWLPTNEPGALHKALSCFAWRNLGLSKIESRPTKTGLGSYVFLMDVTKPMDDVLLPGAIQEMESLGCTVKLLGSYPVYKVKNNIVCA